MTEIPPCYASLAEAFEMYEAATMNGFDGNLNEFLDMERRQIERERDQGDFRNSVKRLMEHGDFQWLERECNEVLSWVCRKEAAE